MDQDTLLKEEINKFLTFDHCDFSPQEIVKGKFLYKEFCQFLDGKKIKEIPGIRAFYNLMEDWTIKYIDPDKRITRQNYSGAVYFKGISVKGKYDPAKDKLNKAKREQMKNYRHKKADQEGRIIIQRKSYPKPQQAYVTQLPNDVSEWKQYKITTENFENWYKWFINELKEKDIEEEYQILNEAINNFRHAKEIRPREFDNNRFKYLMRYVEDIREILREKSDKNDSENLEKERITTTE